MVSSACGIRQARDRWRNCADRGVVASATTQKSHLARFGLPGGFALAASLVVTVLIRYPGNARTAAEYIGLGTVAIIIFLALGIWAALRAARSTTRPDLAAARRLGSTGGLILGILWVSEISFNNFVPPDVSTPAARGIVDNGIWALIAVSMVVLAAVSAYRSRRFMVGVQAGFWSGLVSGLIACLMALLLIVFWLRFVLRDPLSVQEWAERQAESGAPNMATYFAYETLSGALLHLVVLGIIMGGLMGLIGGGIGRGVAALRRA